MPTREEAVAALRAKMEATLAGLEEASELSAGLEKRVVELCREFDRAAAEAVVAMRAASLEEAPECCPECGGKQMRVVRPPKPGGGEKK